jgi:hypothetical protein
MANTYFRHDDWLQDAQGNPISGVGVYVASQPANTGSIPPSPLGQLSLTPRAPLRSLNLWLQIRMAARVFIVRLASTHWAIGRLRYNKWCSRTRS